MKRVFVADASVLIDLQKLGALHLLGILQGTDGCDIQTTRALADEAMPSVSAADLAGYGIQIVQTGIGVLAAAHGMRSDPNVSRRLSENDIELLAHAQGTGGTVWTDDQLIHKTAERMGIDHAWLFTPFVPLVAAGILPRNMLLGLGRNLMGINGRYTQRDFERLCDALK